MRSSPKNTPISRGTRILTADPFAYVLKSDLQGLHCDYCLLKKESLHRCSGCLFVWYCDRFCQRQAWVDHKGECKNLARVKPKVPPDAVRLIGRIVMKLQRGGDNEEGQVSPTKSRKFKDLMSHYKELQEDKKRMEHFSTIALVLNEYLTNVVLPNPVELLGIYGRVCVNSFNIVNGELQCIGTGIYLGPTILDHSCSPNAVATFDGKQINIQLIEDLPFLDWDKVRISYIDQMNSTTERLKELKERYYFDCDCPRCRGGDPNRHKYALKCHKCSLPIPAMKNMEFSCCSCGFKPEQKISKKFWEAAEFSELQLQVFQQQETNYLDICKLCLEKQGDIFHDLCLVRSKMLDAAFEASIQMELWDGAAQYGTQLIDSYRLWYGVRHPLLAVLLLKIAKILMLVKTSKNSMIVGYIKEALSILEVTHGRSNPFYSEEALPLLQQMKQ